MVTGATGFVGSHAVRTLQAAGHEVRLLVRDGVKVERVLGPGVVDPAHVVVGDMTEPEAVDRALEGCDACIHAAAVVSVSTTGGDQSKNTDGARTVLGRAVAAGCDPVVYTSTVGIFIPPHAPVITPDSPLAQPRSGYGRSKVGAEHYTRGLADAGAPIVVVYPGGVTGPDQPVLDSNMEGLAESLKVGLPVCRSGGLSVIDVRDLADVLVAVLEPGRGPRRYMAGGRFFDWDAYAALLADVSGHTLRRFPVSGRALRGMGAGLDLVRRLRPVDWPVNRDSTEFMTTMVPTDDSLLAEDLGITYRPTEETIADALRWLVAAGHLDAGLVPALSP
ncbi:NAD-dependent epimerase/dehydratase family protein [Iamia majanohamensis]|uniref:NAD-dependent epimerase/dehydratase family protein n=1 Tax=Iamia majanohamensis TaxID=467976 RepID=A0AAE9YE01_9ACTN|nr:NAD-dependent epimerase/dehydratase family protein [Iamia majanohamensis]WCO69228.1 NAD-dependent epimerase/dehydratase family protein [Iamia majanohamensis]